MTSERAHKRTATTGNENAEPRDTNSARAQKRRQAGRVRVTAIMPYKFNTNEVRTVFQDGQVWFVAEDVCHILGLANSRQTRARLDADECSHIQIQTGANNRRMGIINESALFALVLTSEKPEARAFRRWVTSDVIPSIRQTGSYGQQSASDPATEHSDIADIINRCPGIYIVIVHKNERRVQHTNGGEVVTLVTEAMSNMMAGALISAQGALSFIQSETLVVEADQGLAMSDLEASISQGAKVAERYVATRHNRTADAEIPPVGLPH